MPLRSARISLPAGALPAGLLESQQLPAPVFTPSTKAEVGDHDENIDMARMIEIIGEEKARTLEALTLNIYARAREIAAERGVIIAGRRSTRYLSISNEALPAPKIMAARRLVTGTAPWLKISSTSSSGMPVPVSVI